MFSNKLIINIINYIDKNINSDISIQILSKKFFYNRYYIMRLFKKEFGMTINKYINTIRIYNSIIQIKKTNHSFYIIALNNGFNSLEYFYETFKSITGVTPNNIKIFFTPLNNLDDKTYYLAQTALINLKILIDFKTKYIKNIEPTIKIKKLSIFK